MELPVFTSNIDPDAVAAALRHGGAAVVTDVADKGIVEACAAEMRDEFDRRGRLQENDFNGYRTLRISSVLGYAPSTAALIGHPLVLAVADAVLKAHCISYRIGSTTGIEIHPGERDQELHTDDSIYPVRIPGMEFQIGVMWALTDFTRENGADPARARQPPRQRLRRSRSRLSRGGVHAGRLSCLLHGIAVAWRRRQPVADAAHRPHQHLRARLAAPGGQPVSCRAAASGSLLRHDDPPSSGLREARAASRARSQARRRPHSLHARNTPTPPDSMSGSGTRSGSPDDDQAGSTLHPSRGSPAGRSSRPGRRPAGALRRSMQSGVCATTSRAVSSRDPRVAASTRRHAGGPGHFPARSVRRVTTRLRAAALLPMAAR